MADPNTRSGNTYVTQELLDYIHSVHTQHDTSLERAHAAPEQHGWLPIQVGTAEGKLLELLTRLTGSQRAVEIGTLAGYSSIRLARGLSPGGRLWTCEIDERTAEVARANLHAADLNDRSVEVVVGPALDTLPGLAKHGPFDLVFIDADKQNYDNYGRWAAANLRPGGLLIGDNVLYFGRLLDPDDAGAAAMRRFHEEATRTFDTVCIPTPEGLLLGIKR